MSLPQIRASFVSTQKEKGLSALIRRESNKETSLWNTLDRFMSHGDGMIRKISSKKF